MALQEKIREMRRARGLTQEQLAEAMGVSTAAVSKWETGQSVPELTMTVALADYFEMSVDALVDYTPKSRRKETLLSEIERFTQAHDFAHAGEVVEEALRRYPNDFEVLVASANVFEKNGRDGRRALTLLSRALTLHSTQEMPSVCRERLLTRMGICHIGLHEYEKAIERLKAGAVEESNDALIAVCYQSMHRYEEANPLFSGALHDALAQVINSVFGLATCLSDSTVEESIALMRWCIHALEGLEKSPGSYVCKIRAMLGTGLSFFCLAAGKMSEAEEALRVAVHCAQAFDRAPDYSMNGWRFYYGKEKALYDSIGESAMSSIHGIIDDELNRPFRAEMEKLLEKVVGENAEG